MRVLAAMSGGVDSAVAAARAVDAGHEVVGVHLALARNPNTLRAGARGCCTIEDAGDARRVADILGIPFYVWDLAERFEQDVIDDFVAEYQTGRTPNPCVRCNQKIKFAALLDKAVALGFHAVSTGHYAQMIDGPHGPELHRAVDMGKDQSYVLAVLPPDRLARSLFPLGDTLKEDVRREAAERGLRVASKPDSHDICFISDGDTQGFLAKRLGRQPGPIVDTDGEKVGEHSGAYGFTVGQRRGLAIGRPAADGKPRYVLSIEPVSNTVVVGSAEELKVSGISGAEATWCAPVPEPGAELSAQVRAHGRAVPARLVGAGAGPVGSVGTLPVTVEVELGEPITGVATGQTLVLYRGTQVIGSSTISATR
ncbi:tRNA 2-thiouridine(34) synthase MnmA [Kineosporia sp. J2-2]|uniref:tRNA-specific 2-thiouridylase MnmA n=1 Tax=Kineosporia corallincola TaxID=2835133 RepID=A0ABS5TF61_9ACTN|nr:tRNA 2-thiouridine(34) synthase MnmA [Kineosporia corallincola]MBT0769725.1 tRNA 2-thiouridine(34) synthase MnmA [Kineosporia corallincola]